MSKISIQDPTSNKPGEKGHQDNCTDMEEWTGYLKQQHNPRVQRRKKIINENPKEF